MQNTAHSSAAGDRPTTTAEPKLITGNFVLAWTVNFIQYLIFYILVTTVALYAIKEFAASDAGSGLAASAFVLGATVCRVFSGYVVDHYGRRKMMLTAVTVVVVASALYVIADSLPLLVAVRGLHGFGYALASTALMALVQSALPHERRAEGTGYYALGSTLATAVGPALGLFLVGSFTYSMLFWICLGTSVLGLVLALFLKEPATGSNKVQKVERDDTGKSGKSDDAAEDDERFSFRSIVDPAVLPIGVFMLLVGLSYSGVITYLNAFADERDLMTGAGFFFVAYAIAMLITRFTLGKLQDRRGDNVVIYVGLLSFALSLVVLGLANSDWHIVAAGALCGLGYGTLMPASQAIAASSVPVHKMGTGISGLLLLTDLGVGIGPIVLGMLVSSTGFSGMYLMLAAVVVVAAAWYAATHGRKDVAKHGHHTVVETSEMEETAKESEKVSVK